jgi:thioredoxin 1
MANECVSTVTDEQFEQEVLRNPGTVLVDFYTAWCPPCRQVAPTIEQLCSENRASLKVLKMDATENPKTASEHGVVGVPTFILFHAGQKVGQVSGVQSKAQFEKWISSSVSGAA